MTKSSDMSRTVNEKTSLVPVSGVNPFEQLTPQQIYDWAAYHLQFVEFKELLNQEIVSLPDFPGLFFVYFIVYDSKGKWAENLVYIGISNTSISQRWKTSRQLPLFTKMHALGIEILVRTFSVLPGMVSPETLQLWEKGLIEKLKPVFNDEDM